ncbi:hypothetical protein PM082_004598 [Marasmius tenuissimus]|nr:hypothetical protein PM082_004598 [Marasmius tenuissimus]
MFSRQMEGLCPAKRQKHSSQCTRRPGGYTTASHLVPGGRNEFDATKPHWAVVVAGARDSDTHMRSKLGFVKSLGLTKFPARSVQLFISTSSQSISHPALPPSQDIMWVRPSQSDAHSSLPVTKLTRMNLERNNKHAWLKVLSYIARSAEHGTRRVLITPPSFHSTVTDSHCSEILGFVGLKRRRIVKQLALFPFQHLPPSCVINRTGRIEH